MALGVRGSNPIWVLVNLAGKLFDDTYYMYVLENTIPYIPAPVYHYPDLTSPWDNPIQFLGNGTLPNDIYFEADKVYRLEFRQSDGLQPPSQNDPLIYEINNYVAGTGGSTPVDTISFSTGNQITNPQFAVINFSSPFSLINATNPNLIEIGPGWFLFLQGTGNVTISQVPLDNSNANPSNAPYALRLQLSGWNVDGVILRQRFQQNGMLWANKTVSTTLTAKLTGAPQGLRAILVDSNSKTLGQVLTVPSVNQEWNEFKGHVTLPATSNTDDPPAAYIDYRLILPSNIDIYLSSIQLIAQELPFEPVFEQDSIERQIDHIYHYDYPIVPVGTIIDYYGFGLPDNYLLCNGQALSRITYNKLFVALTNLEVVTLTSGLNTFTVNNGLLYHVGSPVEGIGIPPSTGIVNITGNTVTISAVATASGPQTLRFFSVGDGDGVNIFNAPDLRDAVLAGAYGNLFPSAGVGAFGGEASHAITINEMPSHNHPGSNGSYQVGGSGVGALPTVANSVPFGENPVTVNVAFQGGSTAMSLIQPTRLVQKLIRYK